MTHLTATDLAAFSRRFRFAGGRLRGVRLRYQRDGSLTADVMVVARPTIRDLGDEPKPVRLRLRLEGVDEFRFQKRAAANAGRITDARFGYFEGKFFVNFDAFGLGPNDRPGIHDFRASDAYLAGRSLAWEVVETRQ